MKRNDHATKTWRTSLITTVVIILLGACQPAFASTVDEFSDANPQPPASSTFPPQKSLPGAAVSASASPTVTAAPGLTPDFSHIIIFVMENHEYGSVIGKTQMPYFNSLAQQFTLLTQYHGVTHPSLPNYISLIGGDTFGINSDCLTCYVNAPNLPDLIEASGRTWRTYQEDMPSPCFIGNSGNYAQKHNPFLYFDNIRTNTQRCQQDVVPLTALDSDLTNNTLPNFSFIVPNLCDSGHNCTLSVVDAWLKTWVSKVMASPAYDQHTLIVLTWDEGQTNQTCCGINSAGGRVATVLISPLARQGFQDNTPYTHYSLLKLIAESWGLARLAHAADATENLIAAPFQKQLSFVPLLTR